jgi:hypothetical protein
MLELAGPTYFVGPTWVPGDIPIGSTWRCVNSGCVAPHARAGWARMEEIGGPECQSLVDLLGQRGSYVAFPSSPQVDVGPTAFTRCPTYHLHVHVSLGQIG